MIPVIHPDEWIDKNQIFLIDVSSQTSNNINADSNSTKNSKQNKKNQLKDILITEQRRLRVILPNKKVETFDL